MFIEMGSRTYTPNCCKLMSLKISNMIHYATNRYPSFQNQPQLFFHIKTCNYHYDQNKSSWRLRQSIQIKQIRGYVCHISIGFTSRRSYHVTKLWFEYNCTQVSKTHGTNAMMRSWHGNTFCITGPLWEESTSRNWIPLKKGQLS